MVLRPYQYYAVEALVDRVMHSHKNGYIWHTTNLRLNFFIFVSNGLCLLDTLKMNYINSI